jgi:hypothetical protein
LVPFQPALEVDITAGGTYSYQTERDPAWQAGRFAPKFWGNIFLSFSPAPRFKRLILSVVPLGFRNLRSIEKDG